MWSVKEIDASELASWQDNEGEFRIIDVREMQEILTGTILGAEPMPLATIPTRLHEFETSEKLVLICRSGARSAQACYFLQQQGYPNVFNLRGGMLSWAASRLPIALPRLD